MPPSLNALRARGRIKALVNGGRLSSLLLNSILAKIAASGPDVYTAGSTESVTILHDAYRDVNENVVA